MIYDQNKNKNKLIKTNENGNWQVLVYQNLVELYCVSGITNYDLQKHNRSLSNSEEKKSVKVIALSLLFLMHQKTTKLKTGIMWVIEA